MASTLAPLVGVGGLSRLVRGVRLISFSCNGDLNVSSIILIDDQLLAIFGCLRYLRILMLCDLFLGFYNFICKVIFREYISY